MINLVKLPNSLREQLKTPLGILLPGTPTRKTILEHLKKDSYLISVGDRTTTNLLSMKIIPSLSIIDGIEKRQRHTSEIFVDMPKIVVDNPAGQITLQSIAAIKHAFEMNEPIRIDVVGEEDLLVVPVCIYAPKNSIVMYGQPDEGLVIVHITSDIRDKAKAFFDMMK